MIIGRADRTEGSVPSVRATNVTWDPGTLDRERRWSALRTRGATIWITGLPASGKSTIAAAVEERLVVDGRSAYRLDGDNLRHGLNENLGFSAEDRAENVRRTAHAARLLADAGTIAVVSLVSPYAADRQLAREAHEAAGLEFIEIFVDTPLEECERRDPKGLYARARAGEIEGMTGIDDPYEAPTSPDLVLRPGDAPVAVDRLLALLRERGVI
jgi:bifunctional enzyme CysN/CysC